MLGMSVLFTLGLVDDFFKIKPQAKLLGQIFVALMVAFFGYRLCWFESLTIDMIVTIFWIVGITNAMNLLDNMDGLCAGVGLLAAFFLSMLLWDTHFVLAVYCLLISGSLFAFLIFNFNPASIFMGDCGSLVIGFSLAFLSVCYAGCAPEGLARYAVPVLVLMAPIFDTSLVTFIRLLSGRRASIGGKDHTSHRLVLIGFSEKRAVLFLYVITSISGLAALFVHRHGSFSSPVVIVPIAIAILLMGIYLAQIRVYKKKEFSVLRDRTFTPILLELTYKRQLALVILDFCLISFSYYLAYRLRFSIRDFVFYFDVFLNSLPAVIACKFAAFYTIGVYRGIWNFFSFNDIYAHLKATALGSLLCIVVITYVYRFQDFSKSIFIVDWLVLTGLLLATRGSFRLFLDSMKRSRLTGAKILLYGAGQGGEILLRELLNNTRHNLVPVGFLDDNPLKTGKKIQGFPVYGPSDGLGRILKRRGIKGLIISFSSPDPEKLTQTRELCKKHDLFLKQFSISLVGINIQKEK